MKNKHFKLRETTTSKTSETADYLFGLSLYFSTLLSLV